jgi:YfiH family protein
MPEPPVLTVSDWEAEPNLIHGFLGRRGGVSSGDFESLNLSHRVGDEPGSVGENRRRVNTGLLEGGRLVLMRQEHGARVVVVRSIDDEVGAADATVTALAGAVLGILTADCVPILMLAPPAVAAVHAGWRGTIAGVVLRALERLRCDFGVSAADVEVALGPAIGGCCYEVDRAVGERFVERWGMPEGDTWRVLGEKGQLDLRRANAHLLINAGVVESRMRHVGPCTRCASADYFSHRGAGGATGRQLSYIGWRGAAG